MRPSVNVDMSLVLSGVVMGQLLLGWVASAYSPSPYLAHAVRFWSVKHTLTYVEHGARYWD